MAGHAGQNLTTSSATTNLALNSSRRHKGTELDDFVATTNISRRDETSTNHNVGVPVATTH